MSITSQIRYTIAKDTAETDGSGKTGLAFGDITAKYLTMGGTLTSLTTETITTLGTYQAPTSAAHIRIKELNSGDPTKGVYEVHFHNTQVTEAGKKLWLFLSATGASFQPLEVDLTDTSLYSTLTATAVRSAVGLASANLDTQLSGIQSDTNDIQTRIPAALSSGNMKVDVFAMQADVITASAIATDAITSAELSSTGTAEIAAAVWDLATSGHTTSGTFGAAMAAAGAAGDPWSTDISTYGANTAGRRLYRSTADITAGSAGGLLIAGSNAATTFATLTSTGAFSINGTSNVAQTGDAYAIVSSGTFGNAAIKGYVDDIGVAGAGLTALGDTRLANLDAAITTRMATYTQPTGFLAATFPTTVASTTNITAAAGVALTSAYDFAKGTVAMTEAYAADGAAPTPAQAFFMVMSYLFERSLSGTTMTAKKLDGSTTSMVFTINDASTPTAQTRSS